MKYDFIIEQSLKSTSLKRVRIKVDPKLVSTECDLSKCDGYEGYILAECGDMPKVLVISPNVDSGMSVMDIPSSQLVPSEGDSEVDILNYLKLFVLQTLEVDLNSPCAQSIAQAQSIEEIEALLKQEGISDDDIKVLYRKFILDENVNLFNEISIGGILNAARNVSGKVASGLSTAAKIGSYALAGTETGSKLAAASSGLANFAKGIKDKQALENIKKLERPPEGKDPATNDSISIELPSVYTGNAKITNIKPGNNNSKIITVKLPPVANAKPEDIKVDQLQFVDTGTSRAQIFYYKGGKQIPNPQVTAFKWPTSIGLHPSGNANQWIINNDLKDPSFNNTKEKILASKELLTKIGANTQAVKVSRTYDELKQALKVDDKGLGEILVHVLKGDIATAGDEIAQDIAPDSGSEPEPIDTSASEQEPAPTTPQATGVAARTAEGLPVPGQSRFTNAKGKKYIYTKKGWYAIVNGNKIDANAAPGQKQITTSWQLANKITPTKTAETKTSDIPSTHTGIVAGKYNGKSYPPPGTDVLNPKRESVEVSMTLQIMEKYQPKS